MMVSRTCGHASLYTGRKQKKRKGPGSKEVLQTHPSDIIPSSLPRTVTLVRDQELTYESMGNIP